MKKLSLSFLAVVCCCLGLSAQKNDLYLRRGDNGFYVEHKVAAKESFFSVGRLYNVNPRSIASYNKMDYNKGLFLDKTIRIPLTDTNFTQKANKGTPLYYKAGEKDDWNSISKTFKVPVDRLRTWNEGPVKKGQKLVVGLLISNEMKAMTFTGKKEEEIVKKDIKEEKEAMKEEKKDLQKAEKEEIKAEEKVPQIKEDPKAIQVVEKTAVEPGNYQQGFFKSGFEQQVRTRPARNQQTVTAGIFKTSSGWQDSKYYLLIDGVAPGTIVRIQNPSNNRTIYAKVLGEMSGIRLNDGLNIRMSNAAAAALEVTETDKFIVKVYY